MRVTPQASGAPRLCSAHQLQVEKGPKLLLVHKDSPGGVGQGGHSQPGVRSSPSKGSSGNPNPEIPKVTESPLGSQRSQSAPQAGTSITERSEVFVRLTMPQLDFVFPVTGFPFPVLLWILRSQKCCRRWNNSLSLDCSVWNVCSL